jgi:hypothetical protein
VALKSIRQSSLHHPSNDLALAAVFAIALALPFGLGILLVGNAPVASTTEIVSTSRKTLFSQPSVARVTKPVWIATLTPAPVVEVVNEQGPESAATTAPTATAGPTATPIPRPTSSPESQPTLAIGHVAQTGGDGVYLRHKPIMSDHWIAWPDNTPLDVLGELVDSDGQWWLQVRDPKNNVGWVPAQYVSQ